MAYLMQISFDNTKRLERKRYLFQYKGIRFKLVQNNPRKWSDVLLTIVPERDRSGREKAFAAAAEFLSALAWEHGASSGVWEAGGGNWPDNLPLNRAQPTIYTFPRIPFRGNVVGYTLYRIPHIQTKLQRIALALFREARASNNDYLSFLFFWQVMDVKDVQPESFIDEAFARRREWLSVHQSDVERLPLAGRSMGEYLLDDCRHAIAHIKRWRGRKSLDLDKPNERMRLAISTRVVQAFAEHYIHHELAFAEPMYLVRPRRGGFPVFLEGKALHCGAFKMAYPQRSGKVTRSKNYGTKTDEPEQAGG